MYLLNSYKYNIHNTIELYIYIYIYLYIYICIYISYIIYNAHVTSLLLFV